MSKCDSPEVNWQYVPTQATAEVSVISSSHFETSAYDRSLDVHLSVIGDFVSANEAQGTWYSSSMCLGTWHANCTP